MASARALQLKDAGNKAFQASPPDYPLAESNYTSALALTPTNPLLYTNRAMARLRQNLYHDCIADCERSLELMEQNMKAHYYMAQAQLEIALRRSKHNSSNGGAELACDVRGVQDALESAERAYELCSGLRIPRRVWGIDAELRPGSGIGADQKEGTRERNRVQVIKGCDAKWSNSLSAVSALVLRCKKELWELLERRRIRLRQPLLRELIASLEEKRVDEMKMLFQGADRGVVERAELIEELNEIYDAKKQEVRQLWEVGIGALEVKERRVPDWLIDDITFTIMLDPVVTLTGHSYERASIMEHLKRSSTDPLTREPLRAEDLRVNLALRNASAEFVQENGWAVDW